MTPTFYPLHQLPSPPADFTGREAELEALRSALTNGSATATLFGLRGMGGVGKTVLALKLAAEMTARYPDAQIYLDLKGVDPHPLTASQAMAHVARSFAPEARLPESEAELAALYRSVLFGKRVLLLMDNAAGREQVAPLIPPAGSLLLITSRALFTLPGMAAKNLDEMSAEEARDLLLRIEPRIAADADEIAGLCGRLPLALRLAGSALSERVSLTPPEYVRRLKAGKERFGDVDASLNLSYELLDEKRRRLWRLLAVFPGTFDASAAAAVWELDLEAAQDGLEELTRISLVEWKDKEERYRLHDLSRYFADSCLEAAERGAGQKKLAEYFLEVLKGVDHLFRKGGAFIQPAFTIFDIEWGNIRAGHSWAAKYFQEDYAASRICADYPNAGPYILSLRQHAQEQIEWRELGLAAARQLRDKATEGTHLGNLGNAYAALGQMSHAINLYEQQLVIVREIGYRLDEAGALGNLGLAHAALGEIRLAIEFYKQQLAITQEIGDQRGQGNALGNLGLAYAALGEPHRAIKLYEQQLAIAQEIGDLQGQSNALGNMGLAYIDLGETQRAIGFYNEALTIDRHMGNRSGESTTLGNLGIAHDALGETQCAIELYEQSLIIHREIGDRAGEGTVLGSLGIAYMAIGDSRRAIELYQQFLIIAREIGDRRGEGNASWNLGLAYAQEGDLVRAADLMQNLVDYLREIGHSDAEKHAAGVEALRARLSEQKP